MLFRFINVLTEKNYPRGFILLVDLLLCFFSFVFSYSLQNSVAETGLENLLYPTLVVLIFRLQSFLFTRSYTGIIKFTSTQDGLRIITAFIISSLGIWLASYLYFIYTKEVFIRMSVIVMDSSLSLIMIISTRLGVKMLFQEMGNRKATDRKNVVIYGADHTGVILKRTLENDPAQKVKVVAFIDVKPELTGKTAEGVPIFSNLSSLENIAQKVKIDELILADTNLIGSKRSQLLAEALEYNINLKAVPPLESWVNGKLSSKQIKNVAIEELLGRDPIELDNENIGKSLNNKVILITGAAGSIGSEIVRQCLKFKPKQILILDQAETPMHDLVLELNNNNLILPIIADIRNIERITKVFDKFRPQIVFHAAAYKHVPLMEDNPYEAITTNVLGTRIVADLAVSYEAEKFIYVSTDKAVNPTNIMGASKRISEIYVQSLNSKLELINRKHTKFITTRFGNVLGSNGSVIPRFKKQIKSGGPVTVTHPEINRYFMTIPEACRLVLEAGSMGNGGEIYIFDMGEPVKIVDLAEKMIRLSGLKPYKDIEIKFTGLRPGEKLKEELLSSKETTIGTHHPKIMIARVQEYNFLEVNDKINLMTKPETLNQNRLLVAFMKELVPEYVSNNSIFEELDQKLVTSKAS